MIFQLLKQEVVSGVCLYLLRLNGSTDGMMCMVAFIDAKSAGSRFCSCSQSLHLGMYVV